MTPSPLSPQQLDELDGLLAAHEAGGNFTAAMWFVTDAPGAMRSLLATVRRQQAVIDAVKAEMSDWTKRCPADDWGSGDIADMVLADAGRHVLAKLAGQEQT